MLAALSWAATLALVATVAAGTFVVKDFEVLVAEAEQIYVGTATSAAAQKLASGAIVTDVTFTASQVLKGPPEATVVLRVLGGTVGRERLELPGVPKFRVGARYLVFVKDNGRAIFPVVGGDHGLFQVVPDPGLGHDVVLNARGAPLTDVPVPLAAFTDAIEQELRLR
jgi:lipoprotein-anchoring transpeptidase ErfK/SrfK